ncbi:hypothetical protein FA15DRAFT_706403 [Coprinopsis marcescibilis]|uniref:Uncharacterized protein n=1 Tax=Coprinopsis marcescibilis TaxID=230819 RepID=A0A5C3KPA6_COPMA|nr:hypothetical protein FA15DRAFT_706403 [Coprinopsis marcescibilis]
MFPPFGVKILWFILSLTGLLACWAVMMAVGRSTGSFWGWTVYCAGCTMLQGIFCLGIVWKMDPFSMPSKFCTLQAIFVALGSFTVTGSIATFSYISHLIIRKPKLWGESKHPSFRWEHTYLLPVAVFPLAATSVYIACVLKLHSVNPVREFYCESSTPQWVRFMSFAGMPLLLSLPSLYISICSVFLVCRTTKHIKRARTGEPDLEFNSHEELDSSERSSSSPDPFTILPTRKRLRALESSNSSIKFSRSSPDPSFQFIPNTKQRNPLVHFHVPMKPQSSDTDRGQDISLHSSPDSDEQNGSRRDLASASTSSLGLPPPHSHPRTSLSDSQLRISAEERPVVSPPSIVALLQQTQCLLPEPKPTPAKCEWKGSIELVNTDAEGKVEDVKWNSNDDGTGDSDMGSASPDPNDRKTELEDENDIEELKDVGMELPKLRRTHSRQSFGGGGIPIRHKKPAPVYLSPIIWRLLIFQVQVPQPPSLVVF